MAPETNTPLDTFIGFMERFDKEGAVAYALSLLDKKILTVPQLYETVLAPSLNRIEVPRKEEDSRIWREHLMSYIVRAVIEAANPFVLRERKALGFTSPGPLALLVCPREEYHELGIRMGADFFTISGFDVLYIGCNTPLDTLLNAVGVVKPSLVVISVTNYLNLAQLPEMVAALRANAKNAMKIYLSGSGLRHAGKEGKDFGADGAVNSYADIQALERKNA